MSDARWQVVKSDPNDQPPMHDPEKPWVVLHPKMHEHRARRETRFVGIDGATCPDCLEQPIRAMCDDQQRRQAAVA